MTDWRAWVAAMFLTVAMPGALAAHDPEGPPTAERRASESDGPAYEVSGLRLQIVSSTPSHEALAGLHELRVTLGQVADGYVAPAADLPQARVPIASAPFTRYYASALRAIS
jgi:hypothetical protein